MTPVEAATAAAALKARLAVPIHYATLDAPPRYTPVANAAETFAAECAARDVEALILAPGEELRAASYTPS